MDTVRRNAPGRAARLAHLAAWSALAASGAFPAFAQGAPAAPDQTPAAAPPSDSGARVFEAAYFTQYNPVTAFDMVSRVPGFDLDDGETRRGFGATAGNVLVNGERPSSKTIISDQLKRIPAASVVRLELVSGSASGSDVRGQSQLVNVVLQRATQTASPTTFVLAARHIEFSDRIGWTAQLSRSFRLSDNMEVAVDLQLPNLRGRSENFELIREPDGTLREISDGFGQPNNIGFQGSAALKWRPTARDNVNFNLQYGPTWNTTGIARVDTLPDGTLNDTLFGRTEVENNYNAEIGGDWEHRFSDALSVKALALATFSNADQHDVFDIFVPAVPLNRQRTQDRYTEAGERVGRVAMTWRASDAHTLEFGVEGAFNYRDTSLDIQQNTNGGPFAPVPLDVSDARVEEVRGEVFVTDVWNVSPALTLESGFTFEASQITQSGSETNEREFTYPKPRLVGTYKLGDAGEFRASIERDVSQLDFSEFASTVNFQDASGLRGNPDLEPEKTWKARLEWERRFGARGALALALFHDEIEDVKDFIVIGGQDALGNIGDGQRTGVEVRAAVPLAPLGIPNAELRFTGQVLQSEVTDPWTGETRAISISTERTNSPSGAPVLNTGTKDWGYLISYRQDLPKLSSAWGITMLQWSGRREYKYDEFLIYDREDPRIDFFFETTAIKPVTIRFSLNNVLSPPETRERYYYAPDRGTGVLTQADYRLTDGGPEGTFSYGVQVSGRF
jgi:hypothetical protein